MAFVPVPKDLNRVKTKVMFNLTKRQLICFSIAAAVGVPIFFLAKAHLDLSTAAMLMVVIMLPFIFFALYEKDGQPAEKYLYHIVQSMFIRDKVRPYGYYHCSKNGQGTRQCSMHYIRYDVLYAYVLSRLQYWSGLVQHDEEQLLKRLLNANDKGQAAARKKQAAELKKAEKRKAEVDTLFARMYEDWAAGRITEYNFSMLSGKYQSEQAELDEKIERLQSAIATESQNAADAEKWIALMKECVNPTELTAELLNTLIEKIVVHEAVKGEDGSREQEVEIFYRFIGKID